MVFVDISGFTKMSERLARHGKVGAEELTTIISTTFGALLVAPYAYGANLLKFGGDALLLLFTNDGHEGRACAAALAMRNELRTVGRCVTSAGQVILRMSVGIHSGSFDFFLVGDSHRELIVAGPAATRTVEMEAAATAGQILISHATWAALPNANRGRSVGPGFLLKGSVEAERPEPVAPVSTAVQLNQFVPIGLCQLLLSGAVEPEHRPATVAFLQYRRFDELIQSKTPQIAAGHLHILVSAVQEAVDARGVTFLGTDIASDGGKIILTAGVPSTTGNDEEQMLLALHQVASTDLPIPLAIGVNWGPVFSGEVGPPYRRTYTVMGDTVNLAARMMSKAPGGQIYATPGVLEGSRTTFQTNPLQPFKVKGKQHPIEALSVGAPEGSKTRQSVDGLPLIGRDPELDRLTRAWQAAETGNGQVVEVSAGAGMGKTRLLDEFLATSQPDRVVRAECRLYQVATPYFPWEALLRGAWRFEDLGPDATIEALTELVETAAPQLEPWLSLIGLPLGLDIAESVEVSQLEDQFRPARTMAAVDTLLEATLPGPVVFVIEDAHWMDEASRQLLAGLMAGVSRLPWLIILTRRPVQGGFVVPEVPSLTRIELEPLTIDQAKDLIFTATEDSPILPQLVEKLARQAAGNPLFLVEILEALRRDGTLEEIPQSVEAMIAARIDELAHTDRNLLRRLAVLGTGFELEHTAAVLGEKEGDPQWRRRAIRRLSEFLTVDQSGWVQFRHALIRDVAYAGLPFNTRQELHARVGDSILRDQERADDDAELLSLHYFYAKQWDHAWRFSRMAGDRAREIYANIEAAASYERALSSSIRLDGVDKAERAEVLDSLAWVRYEAGAVDDAMTAWRQAIRLVAEDPVARADLHRVIALAYRSLGKLSQGLRETALGLKLLESMETLEARRVRARLRARRAGFFSDLLRPRMTLKVGLQAVDEAEASGELEALARAYSIIDEAYQMLGLRDMAVHESKALAIFEELGDLSGIALLAMNLGVQAYADGEWDDAIALYSRAQEVSRRSGNEQAEGNAAANLGEVLVSRGRLEEAESVLQEARRVLRAQKVVIFALFAETQLGRVLLERGEVRPAIQALTRIVNEAIEVGQSFIVVDASVHLADAHVRAGDPEAALQVVTSAQQLSGEDAALYEVPLERVRAQALVALDRGDEALAHAEKALVSARQQRLVYEVALLLLIKAEVDPTSNGEVFEEANRLLKDLGAVQNPRLPSPML